MKPLNIRNIVLLLSLPFLMAWLVACSPHKYPQAFIVADSLMEEQPDSAIALLNAIGSSMHQHGEKDRMYYELLRLKAADKAGSLEADGKKADSILHYYEHGGDRRLLPTAYYIIMPPAPTMSRKMLRKHLNISKKQLRWWVMTGSSKGAFIVIWDIFSCIKVCMMR